MNPKGKYSQSSRDDDDSCADERVFASIGDWSSADFCFAKVKLNSLTHYLYLSMLLSVGPVDVCTVGKNNIRQMMIKYIGKTYSASMEFGSDPADTYEIFRKLNESYMQHIRKMRLMFNAVWRNYFWKRATLQKTLCMPGCW
jgi:hypothetical protein